MRKKLLVIASLCLVTLLAQGQITKEGRNSRGYLRFGFSSFGDELKDDLSNFSVDNDGSMLVEASLRDNILEGRYGTRRGYVFEFGRQYYFNKQSLIPLMDARLGLDWTQLSLTYNELDFSSIARRDEDRGYYANGDKSAAFSISSMIGPVFSISPISKLTIDARAQLAVVYYANLTNYYADNPVTNDEAYFSFFGDAEQEGLEAFTAAANLGFKPNFGATVRYGAIGLAVDYSPGSIKSEYRSDEGNGEAKFKHNVFQIKVSLTL